jgi:ADP-dependent phosphofructokinase/glucokinase
VDEVHIIMEYPKGTQWGGWGPKADRANRVIVSKDESNAVLAALEATIEKVAESAEESALPSLLVLSGIHMLDGREESFVTARLGDLRTGLKKVPETVLVHLELASIGNEFVLKSILDTTLPLVDSIGLNEEELLAVYKALGGTFGEESGVLKESDLTGAVPTVRAVSAALVFVLSKSQVLSRIHFHCFAYHIIALRDSATASNSEANTKAWKNGASAVAAGSLVASTKACDLDVTDLHGNDIELKFSSFQPSSVETAKVFLSDEEPVASWKVDVPGEKGGESASLVMAPVLSCKKVVQTVGLGDAISATALAYQL